MTVTPASQVATMSEDDVPLLLSPPLSPTLSPSMSQQDFHAVPAFNHAGAKNRRKDAATLRPRVRALIMAIVGVLYFSGNFIASPLLRIFEDIFCLKYYQTHDPSVIDGGKVAESYCKVDIVQGELATMRGWMDFCGFFPGLLLAVPFGVLADKYGRKWLLVMHTVVINLRIIWVYFVCAFPSVIPIHFVYLEATLGICGGGIVVAFSLFYVVLSDITPTSQISSAFFRLITAVNITHLIGPSITAKWMETNPWTPLSFGIGLQLLMIPIALALPETLGAYKPSEDTLDVHGVEAPDPSPVQKPPLFTMSVIDPLPAYRSLLTTTIRQSAFLVHTPRLLLLTFTLYPALLGSESADSLVLQYLSTRYRITIARATYILSLSAVFSILVLLVVLPRLSNIILKYYNRSQPQPYNLILDEDRSRHQAPGPADSQSTISRKKDVLLTRLSLPLLALGSILLGLSPSLPLFVVSLFVSSLGSGAAHALRAVLTTYVKPNEVGRLYTALGLVETVCLMAWAPTVAWLYGLGVRLAGVGGAEGGDGGGQAGEGHAKSDELALRDVAERVRLEGNRAWIGLPYFVVGGLLAVVAVWLWVVRLDEDGKVTERWRGAGRGGGERSRGEYVLAGDEIFEGDEFES